MKVASAEAMATIELRMAVQHWWLLVPHTPGQGPASAPRTLESRAPQMTYAPITDRRAERQHALEARGVMRRPESADSAAGEPSGRGMIGDRTAMSHLLRIAAI